MAEAQSSSKGLTTGKAILIGVLSLVLVVVLYIQFGGQAEAPISKPASQRPPRPTIAVQPASEAAKAAPITLASAKPFAKTSAKPEPEKAIASLIIDENRWKAPKLEAIVAYDPFALPPIFPQPPKVGAGGTGKDSDALIADDAAKDAKKLAEAEEQRRLVLEELKQRGVNAISSEGDQYVAVIGDEELRVGDQIYDFIITAIDPDDPIETVHIERKESP